MKRRIFSLLLASVLLCSFRGCRVKDGEKTEAPAGNGGGAEGFPGIVRYILME